MLLIKLWNYLRGYVIIKMSGEYTERLLNQAAIKGIYLWDVRRINSQTLTAKIGVKDFFRLCRLSRKTRSRIRILQRAGFSFLCRKLIRRKMLIVGGILFIFALYFLSSLIWSIEILAEDPNIKAAVEEDLEIWGIRAGKLKHQIDRQLFADRILDKYDDVAWAQIYFKGSRIVVEIIEKNLPPEIEDSSPCDIVASKDGIIEKIIPFGGEVLVKPGDTVSRGDVLIGGRTLVVTGKDDKGEPIQKSSLVAARGIITARVWYQRAVKVPLIKEESVPTGVKRTQFIFRFGDKKVSFPLKDPSFPHYEKELIRSFDFLGKVCGDFGLDIAVIRETKISKGFLGVDEASFEAERYLLDELQAFDAAKITQKRTEYILDSEKSAVIGSLTVETIEEIGVKSPLFE